MSAARTVSVEVTIREAREREIWAVARLAQLDSAPIGRAPFLVAEVGGQMRAALSLADGSLVADPFTRTAELADLLHVRAEQLALEARDGSRPKGMARRALHARGALARAS